MLNNFRKYVPKAFQGSICIKSIAYMCRRFTQNKTHLLVSMKSLFSRLIQFNHEKQFNLKRYSEIANKTNPEDGGK